MLLFSILVYLALTTFYVYAVGSPEVESVV